MLAPALRSAVQVLPSSARELGRILFTSGLLVGDNICPVLALALRHLTGSNSPDASSSKGSPQQPPQAGAREREREDDPGACTTTTRTLLAAAVRWVLERDAWFLRIRRQVTAPCSTCPVDLSTLPVWSARNPLHLLSAVVRHALQHIDKSDGEARVAAPHFTAAAWFISLRSYAFRLGRRQALGVLNGGPALPAAREEDGNAVTSEVDALEQVFELWPEVLSLEEEETEAQQSRCMSQQQPHWFVHLSEAARVDDTLRKAAEEVEVQVGQQLVASHPHGLGVFFDEQREPVAITLAVTDNSCEHAHAVPAFINGVPVQVWKGAPSFPQVSRPPVPDRGVPAIVAAPMCRELQLYSKVYLQRHPDVVALSGGYRHRRGIVFVDEPCVIAYVRSKQQALPSVCCVDACFGSFPVDVEQAPSRHEAELVRNEPPDPFYTTDSHLAFGSGRDTSVLRVGDTIHAHSRPEAFGTLGCFVARQGDQGQRVCGVTAGHVLPKAEEDVRLRLPACTTNIPPVGRTCLTTYEGSARPELSDDDLALFELAEDVTADFSAIGTDMDWEHMRHERVSLTGSVSKYVGPSPEDSRVDARTLSVSDTVPSSEPLVFKFGHTTRLTAGVLAAVPLFMREERVRIRIRPWQGCEAFAQRGDSGAVVFDDKGGVVGVLVQAWQHQNFCVVIPISEVQHRLGVQLLGAEAG
ncbi:hypothetical protein PTSG_10118 [Salpingoeca rosetta]|uniref:Peptidase S1 domain-containing protein n=1 Tax=Salpingoeca rosetta (strain ATCC 50818 / BSB-021) TaxID=946362 RepID=F2UPJ6_SALR5|nr:uncharacterized protein PTSG_10118 [Salpingoeca rosetta]EGD79551.1 hypothetical protein PTSG_10118 [Salpingoeca rosetta]|eukprot:XP_004989032.1 hypothetical protein PTSG_10118 [Salpingoeca rosetta]